VSATDPNSLERSINAFIQKYEPWRPLLPLKPDPQPIGPARGTGYPKASATGGSGGIASPLTETSYSARTYHAAMATSSDGLFSFAALASITLLDNNGASVTLNFAAPA
jgi:hypothetical protein